MLKFQLLAATAIAMVPATAWAQDASTPAGPSTKAQEGGGSTSAVAPAATPTVADRADQSQTDGIQDIVVTAQRQSEVLQNVPIAVTAFNAQALQAQQINTTSDLQLTLPNITFTKGNFTSSSSFNIRGIGDLCVGVTCDAAAAVHVNDVPVLGSPIFQNEYFDLERVEVLRGPQGTLFGRNATGGVINFITAKPDLSGIHASGDVEYGNYNSLRVKGMLNLPLTDTIGVRLAGYYLRRDGFTYNSFSNSDIDGRDQYDVRASIRWQPTSSTTLDIVGHYFRERDDRSRIQKQLCHRDPTGVLGCLPDRLDYETTNGDSTLAGILTSREFLGFGLGASFTQFALGSIYATDGDAYTGVVNTPDVRQVRIDSLPRFATSEKQVLAQLTHNFGPVSLKLDGGYTEGFTDSTVDYNLAVERSPAGSSGLLALAGNAAAPAVLFPGGVNPYTALAAALIPNGPNGALCQSLAEATSTGVFSGKSVCAPTSLDFDRSTAYGRQYAGEAILSSNFDGAVNFLIGGGYLNSRVRDNSYYVNSFSLDYASGLIGAATALGARLAGGTIPNVVAGTPFYRNNSDFYRLESYGVFGEGYLRFSDRIKLTLGLRYNHDDKFVSARTTLFNDTKTRALVTAAGTPLLDAEGRPIATTTGAATTALVPYGAANFTNALNYAALDYDPVLAGVQPFANGSVSFGRLTGRAVLDFQITPANLLYASYSRGYKSGGINPPLSPIFTVDPTFGPETVNAFEIGTKNTFLGGTLRLNATAFYYQYQSLQLSRIVARTSVNDNIDADIYGAELEAVIKPSRALLVNLNFSYLHTRVKNDKFLGNPQDPSGGRSDAVIIKDITNASNCAVRPANGRTGTAAGANAFVATVNSALGVGLRAPTAIPGTTATGAFSVCSLLAAAAAGSAGSFNPALAPLQALLNFNFNGGVAGSLPYVVDPSGVLVNIRGNELPQSPHTKFSAGIQYTIDLGDWNIVPRADLTYTGGYYGSIFNRNVNRIQGYEVVNAQVQLNAPDQRFFVRAFVQNLTKNDAITGLYVTDQSSGLFTNAFTLEPRRYGVAAGFRF